MKTNSKLTRLALVAVAVLGLGSTVMAGPGPMFMMIDGKMMKVEPMTKDVTMKNGCKVCAAGTLTDAKGKTVKLKNGEGVSAQGTVMTPFAKTIHGG
jgi:hypothetical protein